MEVLQSAKHSASPFSSPGIAVKKLVLLGFRPEGRSLHSPPGALWSAPHAAALYSLPAQNIPVDSRG